MNMKLILALTIVLIFAWVIASVGGFITFMTDNDIKAIEIPSHFYRKFRKKYTKLGSFIPVFFISISALPVLIPAAIAELVVMGATGIKKAYDRIFIEKLKPEPIIIYRTPSAENGFEKPEVPVIQIVENTKYERR